MTNDDERMKAAKDWVENLRNRKFKSGQMFVDYQEPHKGNRGEMVPEKVICACCDKEIDTLSAIEIDGDFYCDEQCTSVDPDDGVARLPALVAAAKSRYLFHGSTENANEGRR